MHRGLKRMSLPVPAWATSAYCPHRAPEPASTGRLLRTKRRHPKISATSVAVATPSGTSGISPRHAHRIHQAGQSQDAQEDAVARRPGTSPSCRRDRVFSWNRRDSAHAGIVPSLSQASLLRDIYTANAED